MSIFDEIIAIKKRLEAMKPDSWIDFVLLTTEPFQDMLFRVEHEDKWYLIVNKTYDELLQEILESVTRKIWKPI